MNLDERYLNALTDDELREYRHYVSDWEYEARKAYARMNDLSAWNVLYDFQDLQREVNYEQRYREARAVVAGVIAEEYHADPQNLGAIPMVA